MWLGGFIGAGFAVWFGIRYVLSWVRHLKATKRWSGIVVGHHYSQSRGEPVCEGAFVRYSYHGVHNTASIGTGCGQPLGTRWPIMIDPHDPKVASEVGSSHLLWEIATPLLVLAGIVGIVFGTIWWSSRRQGAPPLAKKNRATNSDLPPGMEEP